MATPFSLPSKQTPARLGLPRAGTSKLLPVPYFVQPTGNTCQSTVLKMFAAYIEREVLHIESAAALELKPVDIYATINGSESRPDKEQKNSHANMMWWLKQRFPTINFKYVTRKLDFEAIEQIVRFINSGFPVLASVSHARVAGHFVLVLGYENYLENASSPAFRLVVHDPFGAFDPSLLSDAYGKQRYSGGLSLQAGGEMGPGTAVRLDPLCASKQKKTDWNKGTFYLISVG
jgi:hypothetical protein